jgi:hypothetical protein
VVPFAVGIIAGKYVARIANFCIMLAVLQVDLFIIGSPNTGESNRFADWHDFFIC